MNIEIPFTSEIDFKSNISEITKMSLEHDYNVSDGKVLGNFYVSGEYKTHEVSMNKEPFNYTLPFTVELRNDINKDSLEFNIEDFSYDIVDKSRLKVNILYSLNAEMEKEEELFERVDDDEIKEELEIVDEFLKKEEEEKIEEPKEEEKKESVKVLESTEEVKERGCDDKDEKMVEEVKEEDERLSEKEEKTVMDSIKDSTDTFVTYHIHIVKEQESIETISALYNIPSSIIKEYNELDSYNVGDKILIPKVDE